MTFEDIFAPGTVPQVLGTGYGFAEGPAADAAGNVYFSDGQKDSIHFYQVGQPVRLFADDSTDANGMIFNRHGELLVCEGAAHRVVAIDLATRRKRVLASEIDGTHFNEPNDLAVDRFDGVYFSDPNYQHRGQPTVMKEDAYYVSSRGVVTRVSTVCTKPNGVLLSQDNADLYLADAAGRRIFRYDVAGPGQLIGERLWIADVGGKPDGLTLDEHGNLYVCCGAAGLKVFSHKAELMGTLAVEYASNCVFGGPDFTTLFVTSRDKFLGVPTCVRGILPPCAEPSETS